MSDDERYMRRAIALARSVPNPSPNPRVGALFVRDGEVIAEGVHRAPGMPHAEAAALASTPDVRGATCYVNLEPCSHHGLTPPCAPALAEAGIARVVAAIEDPDPRVLGDGLTHLHDRGVETVLGVLADEARELNAAYIHHRRTGRPLVTLKLALTLDGRLGAPDSSARWITSPETRRRVHRRRAEAGAVMVGAGTVVTDDPQLTPRDVVTDDPQLTPRDVVTDDPQLTPRDVGAVRPPLRIAVDSGGRIAPDARIFSDDAPTLIATTARAPHEVQTAWKESGAEVIVLPEDEAGRVDLDALVRHLGARDVLDLFCEGGGGLATSLLREDLADRLEAHLGPLVVGPGGPAIGDVGVTTMDDARRWQTLAVEQSGPDAVLLLERAPE